MAKVTIEDVCKAAWEATRSQSAVPYDDLVPSYRANLVKRAEAVLAGEWPADPWKAFETQVCQLADGRGNMQIGSETKAELVEEPVVAPKKARKKKSK